MLALALAVGAAPGAPVRVVLERDQRGDVVVDDEPHVATLAAVAAVGPTHRRVRLPAERHAPGATVSTLDVEPTLINELRPPRRQGVCRPVTIRRCEQVAACTVVPSAPPGLSQPSFAHRWGW